MLNYIWLGLIGIAIVVALGRDVHEETTNRFRNNEKLSLHVEPGTMKVAGANRFAGITYMTKAELSRFYGASEATSIQGDTVFFGTSIVQSPTNAEAGALTLTLPANAPPVMVDAAAANGDKTKIIGNATFDTATVLNANPLLAQNAPAERLIKFLPPTVHFRILAKVADEGILKTANVAVDLALGLIGVMALWLGIMKIAEAAGLVLLLSKLVKPIMTRIFPDVPPDHPAMGSMLMNMAANFLGLSNAATPLGLKAMEDLELLNPNPGTATNAMCMFLTINTTALTMVPTTVIAIRLTLGSTNPTDIIMPTFLATFISLILGIVFTMFIQRFFPIHVSEGGQET